MGADLPLKVFISHSSADTWVARQIAAHIQKVGALTFLDAADIEHGDDFDEKILGAAHTSDELLILLTPWAIQRPYIWQEIGAFWFQRKRIVGVLNGLTAKELSAREEIPISLKRSDLVDINKIDSYFEQLKRRVENVRRGNG